MKNLAIGLLLAIGINLPNCWADIAVTPGVGKTVATQTNNSREYQGIVVVDPGGASSMTITSGGAALITSSGIPVSQQGTWTSQIGNTQNTTAILVRDTSTINANVTQFNGSTVETGAAGALEIGVSDDNGNDALVNNGGLQVYSVNVSTVYASAPGGGSLSIVSTNTVVPQAVYIDSQTWTLNTSTFVAVGGVYIANPSAIPNTSTATASIRISPWRAEYMTLMDNAGVILGTSTANPLFFASTGTVAVAGTANQGSQGTTAWVVTSTAASSFPVNASQVGNWAVIAPGGGSLSVVSTNVVIGAGTATMGAVTAPGGGSLSVVSTNTAVTFGAGQIATVTSGTGTFPAGLLVSSTTLSAALTQGTTATAWMDSIGRTLVTGLPFTVIKDTWSVNESTGTGDVILVSSPSAPTRTFLCGIMCYNTSSTNSGLVIWQGASNQLGTSVGHPIGLPANDVPAGIWPGCSQPFFWSLAGGQIVITPDAAITSVKCHAQYYQSP